MIILVLMQMKHERMGIGFIKQNMVFFVMEKILLDNLTHWIIT